MLVRHMFKTLSNDTAEGERFYAYYSWNQQFCYKNSH
jgi:hypothetical protein